LSALRRNTKVRSRSRTNV